MPELAFFPWLELDEEYVFGKYKLIPYEVGKYEEHGFPETIDKVLEPYKDSHNSPLKQFVLIQVKGKKLLMILTRMKKKRFLS